MQPALSRFLRLKIGLTVLLSGAGTCLAAPKFPPYPDVWGYFDGTRGFSHLCKGEDGDLYIVPSKFYDDAPQTKIRALFAERQIQIPIKDVEVVLRGDGLIAGEKLKCFGFVDRAARTRLDYPPHILLSDGSTVDRGCFGGGCGYPFQLPHLEIKDKDRHVVARRSFFMLYTKPRTEFPRVPPGDRVGLGKITERVEQLDVKIIDLDGTTFLANAGLAVFRFDSMFRTKMALESLPVLVVDTSVIEAIYQKAEEDHARRGGVLGDQSWYQLLQDRVASALSGMRKQAEQR